MEEGEVMASFSRISALKSFEIFTRNDPRCAVLCAPFTYQCEWTPHRPPPPTHTHSQYSPFMTGVMRYLRHGYALSASRTHWYFSATSSSIIRFRRETLNSVASPTDAFHGESMSMNNMSLSQATWNVPRGTNSYSNPLIERHFHGAFSCASTVHLLSLCVQKNGFCFCLKLKS